jgi:4-hydroxy-tetrahydrodipicolinate reductase
MVKVAVSGAGQMGNMVLHALEAEEGLDVVGVIEVRAPAGEATGAGGSRYPMLPDAAALFAQTRPDVVVDFTNAAYTPTLVDAALVHGVRPVIGTSGIDDAIVAKLRAGLAERKLGGVIAPNFALGAVILMHFSKIAARFFDAAEIIELHHDRKVDAPSGTALATARLMREARGRDFVHNDPELTTVDHTRGGAHGGVAIHSVRLPGLVGHQEVIFGGTGQTLVLRSDTIGRDSYMPGVMLAVREVMNRDGLVIGLDSLIGLD